MGLWAWLRRLFSAPPSEHPDRSPEHLLAEARKLVAQSRFDEATVVYTHVRGKDRTPQVLAEFAHVYLALGQEYWAMYFALEAQGQGTAGAAAARCIEGMVA